MKEFISDVANFKSSEGAYKANGHAYRRGYLIHGAPKTGKSAIGEIIAQKYNMTVYQIQLNSKDLEDNDLKLIVSKMVPNSILFVDEVEKQMESMKKQKIAYVTMAGVLSALDGPQKMSHGSIVIMTSNKKTFLPEDEENALIRAGRIDQVFHFQEAF
jgi:mitochondrial chaperone BCS1